MQTTLQRRCLVGVCALLITCGCPALLALTAPFSYTFGGSGFDSGSALLSTSSGEIVVLGRTRSVETFSSHVFLQRLSPAGEHVSSGLVGESGVDPLSHSYFSGESLVQTESGGFIWVGRKERFRSSAGIIVGTDPSGSEAWRITDNVAALFSDICDIGNDEFFVVGGTSGRSMNQNAVWMLVRADGSRSDLIQWDDPDNVSERATAVVMDHESSNIVVAGEIYHQGATGFQGGDLLVVIVDRQTGLAVHDGRLPGLGDDRVEELFVLGDGTYLIVGRTTSLGPGATDVLLAIVDESALFRRVMVVGTEDDEYVYAAARTSDGGVIVTGFTVTPQSGRDLFLLKLDASWNIEWRRTYGGAGDDIGFGVAQTADGGFTVTGSSTVGSNDEDVFLLSTDGQGIAPMDATPMPWDVLN